MKYKILFWVSICFCFVYSTKAQKEIIMEFNNFDDFAASAELTVWKNGEEFILLKDTVINNRIIFNVPDSVNPGMFNVKFYGNLPLNEIRIIYDGKNQTVILYAISDMFKISVKGGGETEKYYTAKNLSDSLLQRIINFQHLLNNYNREEEFAKTILNCINKEIKMIDNIYREQNEIHKGSMFLSYFNAERNFIPDIGDLKDNIVAKAIEHYFDFFDPLDTLLWNSYLIVSKTENFLTLALKNTEGTREENIKKAVDNYMNRIISSDRAVNTIANIMRKWLNKYGFETIMEYIDIQYLSAQCDAGQDFNLQDRLEAYKRLAPGKTAPEITWMGFDKNIYMLSKLQANKKIIIFWATWCPNCEELLPKIYKYLSDKPDIKVVAIALDESKKPWEDIIKSFSGWYHLRAVEKWQDETVKTYAVSATPVIYIIDSSNKIQKKVSNWDDFILEINK